MADNVTLNAGSGGSVMATDDISSVHHQLVKVEYGVDGDANMVSGTNPLPVVVSGNGTQNLPFIRYLDTVGDGSGTKNAAVDHSGAAESYQITPGAGVIMRVQRLVFYIRDGATWDYDKYGTAVVLTNGIEIRVYDAGTPATVLDISHAIPIKSTGHLAGFCGNISAITTSAGTDHMVSCVLDFTACGQVLRLDGDADEQLEVVLHDDFSGLVEHYFVAYGYTESAAT